MNGRVFRAALVLVITAVCALVAVEARAQGTVKLPLEKAVMSGDMAKRALTKTQISGDIAQAIVNACVDLAKASNGTLTVFVLDPDGEIAASHRMDGQNKINTVTGLKKAQTALWLRIPTHQAANQFNSLDAKIIRESLDMYLVAGGLPIVVDDQLIGSIGIGGSGGVKGPDGSNFNDEQIANYALTKVLGPQPPLTMNVPADPLGQNAGQGRGGAGAGAAPGGGRGGRGGAGQ
jgi:glc operon protein GlcG